MRASSEHVTLAVLAGGEGSRMGQPKGLLTVAGSPILEQLHERIRWDGPTLLITAPGHEHPPGWQRFGRELVDPVAGQGPLRGIVTALESSTASDGGARFVFLPVDMPLMGGGMLRWLIDQHGRLGGLGLMMQRRIDNAMRIEPMPVALHVEALPILRTRLSAGRRSLHGLASESGFSVIDAPAEWGTAIWTNLNSVDDLREFNAKIERGEIEAGPPTIRPEGAGR